MRSVFYWEKAGLSMDRGNPYGALLARAMSGLDVELTAGFPQDLTEAWLAENRGRVDVLHLNWPHQMYDVPDLGDSVARCADLVGRLAHARSLGYKVVWTVHNLYPHDRAHFDLHRLARPAIARLATALIVHCRNARSLVKKHIHREEGVFVVPHGHFIDAYPNTISREEARRRLGFSDRHFVYLFFGNIKRYKGIERLLEIFAAMPDQDLALLLAVKTFDDYSAEVAEKAKGADPRVHVHPSKFFANEEFQVYLNAADVAVLPFLDVLTSGSAITAMGFGRPVIAPSIGCLPELVDDGTGLIYDPARPDALAGAMHDIRKRDLQSMGRAAYRRVEALSWDSIAPLTLEAYRH